MLRSLSMRCVISTPVIRSAPLSAFASSQRSLLHAASVSSSVTSSSALLPRSAFSSLSLSNTNAFLSSQQWQQRQQQKRTISSSSIISAPTPSSSQSSSAPPRLVYSFSNIPNFRLYSLLNGGQFLFWSSILSMSWLPQYANEIPTWWGALGGALSIAFGAGIQLRSNRIITELAIYPDNQTIRVTTSNWNSVPRMQDIPISSFGPNHDPRPKSRANPQQFLVKVDKQFGFHLIDVGGRIYDLNTMQRILGYDVRDMMNDYGVNSLNIVYPNQQQQQQQNQQENVRDAEVVEGQEIEVRHYKQPKKRRGS